MYIVTNFDLEFQKLSYYYIVRYSFVPPPITVVLLRPAALSKRKATTATAVVAE